MLYDKPGGVKEKRREREGGDEISEIEGGETE
jgi:hypothetical protein